MLRGAGIIAIYSGHTLSTTEIKRRIASETPEHYFDLSAADLPNTEDGLLNHAISLAYSRLLKNSGDGGKKVE